MTNFWKKIFGRKSKLIKEPKKPIADIPKEKKVGFCPQCNEGIHDHKDQNHEIFGGDDDDKPRFCMCPECKPKPGIDFKSEKHE